MKSFFAIAALCLTAFAQDITVSKDSLKVYNNPVMSFADEIVFTSHSLSSIHLDSAYLVVDELDPVLAGLSHSEMEWKSGSSAPQLFVWDLDSLAPKTYKLIKKDFEPPSSEPLVFSASGQTSQIFFLEIGYCFICEVIPLYPKYIKGTMRLFFSNGQVVELKLWSQDLRTRVIHPSSFSPHPSPTSFIPYPSSFSYRFLANGRRAVVGNGALLRRNQVSGTKLFER